MEDSRSEMIRLSQALGVGACTVTREWTVANTIFLDELTEGNGGN